MAEPEVKQKKSFNMDLDSDGGSTSIPIENKDIPAAKPLKIEKFVGENIILPVPTEQGVSLKDITDTSPEEFLAWVSTVFVMSDEMTTQTQKAKLSDVKVRKTIFNTIVKLHESKWLFHSRSTPMETKTEKNN
jgi:hypothetical protein